MQRFIKYLVNKLTNLSSDQRFHIDIYQLSSFFKFEFISCSNVIFMIKDKSCLTLIDNFARSLWLINWLRLLSWDFMVFIFLRGNYFVWSNTNNCKCILSWTHYKSLYSYKPFWNLKLSNTLKIISFCEIKLIKMPSFCPNKEIFCCHSNSFKLKFFLCEEVLF